ncbi:ClpXP protease specificity-enhancing factor [Stenotrophomonas sp. W1S232]|jgi:Stringent starvation protein B|uniref:ClpXP protease specificity-enhancing factor n=1 Tax=Stenotrophomonas koreensis TaxID=266128 RepID=A0A0R0BL19_9GAMM|nr:ClpXP protease specificity-enhancing factor [Stenotrophomonas koreensis]KRG57861.1 peptidase [Stenotrophomonas koreensis]MBB1116330.1 ClpXP protease specificity-enhancing factor [Stenotrophomonas koreensis]
MSQSTFSMTSHRPYLLRALVEWINDNDMTPHLLVDASVSGVMVPPSAVHDGRVILNIAERAVAQLHMDNHEVSFSARFGGVSQPVRVPIAAVLAVYARENGQGMALPDDLPGSAEAAEDDIVIDDPQLVPAGGPQLAAVPSVARSDDGDDEPPAPGGPGKRPFLRVVK